MEENMQHTIENLSNLERKLQVTVPAEHIEDKLRKKLNKIATTAKLPGFRPGKTPLTIIKNVYGKMAHAEVIDELLKDTYTNILEKENLNPVGSPDVKITSANMSEPLTYTVTLEVYPEIKLIDLQQAQLEIEKEVSEIADPDVDETLEKMRKNHVTWKEIEDALRKSQTGDQVTIDFTTKVCTPDGAPLEPKTEKDVKIVLGDGAMWSEFEQQLFGLGKGEEKQFILQIPKTHIDKNIAGKNTEFLVKVHQICEPILPPFDDEFAVKMGIKEGGIAKLKETTRGHMERELQLLLKKRFKKAVMDKLLELHAFDIPKFLIEKELKSRAEDWQKELTSNYGTTENMPVFPRHEFEPQAKRHIAEGLFLREVVKQHKPTVTKEEVQQKIKEMADAYYEDAGDVLKQLFSNQYFLEGIEAVLLEEKVIEHLTTQLKTIDKSISYKDLIQAKNNISNADKQQEEVGGEV